MSGERLNPFEHALLRPDAYIGSIDTKKLETYFLNIDAPQGEHPISIKEVFYNRGLFNIIREIGSNCIDNRWRSEKKNIPMKSIKITWDTENKMLIFWNDGAFISAEKKVYPYKNHRTGKIKNEHFFPAEVFFGEMLAGTNFNDDDEERKTSGRNGMGSKLTNIFSSEFIVEHADIDSGKKFYQKYTKNATERTEPNITVFRGKNAYTEISFKPDFKHFGYKIDKKNVEKDFIGVLGIYILEIAAMTMLPVHFTVGENKKIFTFKTFEKYVRMFYPDTKLHKLSSMTLKNGDECVIVESHTDNVEIKEGDEGLPDTLDNVRHISFVNGLNTRYGGLHVNAWKDAIFPAFVREFNSRPVKKGETPLKTSAKEVYPYITIFLRTEMNKPSFDEQTKDTLNFPEYNIYSAGKTKMDKDYNQSLKEEFDELITKMLKWNFVKLLENKLLRKGGKEKVVKTKKRVNFGDKVQEANFVTTEPEKCSLYFGEGLSAKGLVEDGISTIPNGQDYNGVLAIQGKFPNVRDEPIAKIKANKEFVMICAMLNIKIGVKYDKTENFKTLRYQKALIFATDMDDDGIHIRGLLINLFYTYWPELFKLNIIKSLSTAINKVIFPNKKDPILFYSQTDYKNWREKEGQYLKIKEVKYLKGLGSINTDDVAGYFNNPKIVDYFMEGNEEKYMKLGFDSGKKSSDERKIWVLADIHVESENVKNKNIEDCNVKNDNVDNLTALLEKNEYIYDGKLGVSSFIDKQLIIYHKMAICRAIPNIMDGLKNGQRKVLFAIRKRNYKVTTDLEKVTGAVKELTKYLHGGVSLLGTILNMAVRYPGSNNIALLQTDGRFGGRSANGDDAAQPRYISTALEEIAKTIFLDIDDNLLTKNMESGVEVEYEFFLPVICMLLINGAIGIGGGGFATNIPDYNPEDVLRWTRAWIKEKHKELPLLIPWYRGITGSIELEMDSDNIPVRWRTTGVLTECGKNCKITRKYKDGSTGKIVTKKCKGEPGWWHITDLPVGVWTNELKIYIEYLESGSTPEGKSEKSWPKLETKCITDYRAYNTANKVYFMIKPAKGWNPDIDTNLKLMTTTRKFTNMVTIDANNYPTRHATAEDILSVWCTKRLKYYNLRYDYLLDSLTKELQKAQNKYIFVKAVIDKKLNMYQEDEDLEKDIENFGIQKMEKDKKNRKENEDNDEDNDEDEDSKEKKENIKYDYSYLLRMQMRSMTIKKLEEIKKDIEVVQNKINELKSNTATNLWEKDLDNFEKAYHKYINRYPLI